MISKFVLFKEGFQLDNMIYIEPEMDITMFVCDDVITTSTGNTEIGGDGTPGSHESEVVLPDDTWE